MAWKWDKYNYQCRSPLKFNAEPFLSYHILLPFLLSFILFISLHRFVLSPPKKTSDNRSRTRSCGVSIYTWELLRHNIHTLTPWSWALLEKLTVVHLLKNFAAFYGTLKFITVFISAIQWSLCWARSIQSIPPQTYLSKTDFNIILPTTSWPS
jgi:hypothetical protein